MLRSDDSIAVVMITLNEAHNLHRVLGNVVSWADEIFIVDSFSRDNTIDIALAFDVNVVQRKFDGFGNQWNFAINSLPITSKWTIKIDPDEELSTDLKESIKKIIRMDRHDGIIVKRRLWFLGSPLPVYQPILRAWRTGSCKFTEVVVNEHPVVQGKIAYADGFLEHYDSPDLHHWIVKQNKYTTFEAIAQYQRSELSASPKLFGTAIQRRMWLKKFFWFFPFRYSILFLYHYIVLGSFRAGRAGFIWASLRTSVYRLWEYKYYEIVRSGKLPRENHSSPGVPDGRVQLYK